MSKVTYTDALSAALSRWVAALSAATGAPRSCCALRPLYTWSDLSLQRDQEQAVHQVALLPRRAGCVRLGPLQTGPPRSFTSSTTWRTLLALRGTAAMCLARRLLARLVWRAGPCGGASGRPPQARASAPAGCVLLLGSHLGDACRRRSGCRPCFSASGRSRLASHCSGLLGSHDARLARADPKIRIYDSGMKKYGVDAFPHCVHLVRCASARPIARSLRGTPAAAGRELTTLTCSQFREGERRLRGSGGGTHCCQQVHGEERGQGDVSPARARAPVPRAAHQQDAFLRRRRSAAAGHARRLRQAAGHMRARRHWPDSDVHPLQGGQRGEGPGLKALACRVSSPDTAPSQAAEAMRRAKFKFPGRQKIIASKNWRAPCRRCPAAVSDASHASGVSRSSTPWTMSSGRRLAASSRTA